MSRISSATIPLKRHFNAPSSANIPPRCDFEMSVDTSNFERLWALAPAAIRRNFKLWKSAMLNIDATPFGKRRRVKRIWARRLGVSINSIQTKRALYRGQGDIALLDKRFSRECWPQRTDLVPSAAIAFLKELAAEKQLAPQAAARAFLARLARWQNGDASAKIPGWTTPPQGNPPPGCTIGNLRRYVPARKKTVKPMWRLIVDVFPGNRIVARKEILR